MSEDIEAKLAEYRQRGARQAMLGLTDVDGVLRGKFVGLDKLGSLLEKGGGFCDCVFGWDIDDQLYEHPAAQASDALTGWHTGFPDARYRLLAKTERVLADGTPYFIGEFVGADGEDHPLCPRSALRRTLAKAAEMGLAAKAGLEYELFVFRETPASVRRKDFRDLAPYTPGNFGYSVLRAAAHADDFEALLGFCADFAMPLEGLHCETGPGVWEAALAVADGLESADRGALFKTFSKAFFQQRELMATFMAKWSMDYPGQSGHYHFSFAEPGLNGDQRDVFAGEGVPDHARWALGGLVRYVPELLPMLAPNANSFTRLVKGAWAPTASTWGVDNRTAAFRFIPGAGAAQHVECRVGGADGNPYLVAAATLGAALAGIEERLDPGPPVAGNAYDAEDDLPAARRFPPTLRAAAERFGQSALARRLWGDAFVDHFAATRLWETREAERHVNDWQLRRYFELA